MKLLPLEGVACNDMHRDFSREEADEIIAYLVT